MLYLIITTTRQHCDMNDPEVAKIFEDSYKKLIDHKRSGKVKMAFLSGPFTKMKMSLIIDADNHDDAYEFITNMPCWCYMDNELYPVIQVEKAIDGLRTITEKSKNR